MSEIGSDITLSIIIPVYNAEKHLKNCLDSLIGSLKDDIEIIPVDDGSTDGSPAICDEYRNRYEQISVIHQDNGGASAARNAGLKKARGRYVTFIDSDDKTDPGYIERIREHIAKGCDIIAFPLFVDYPQRNYSRAQEFPLLDCVGASEAVRALETAGALNMVANKVYRRSMLNTEPVTVFSPRMDPGEDLLFNCGCFPKASRVTLDSKPYYHWIRRGEDTLANRFRKDLFEKNKRFIEARCKLYRELSMEESDFPLLAKGNLAYIFACVPNMYRKGSRFFRSERIAFYKELLCSEDIRRWIDAAPPGGTLIRQFVRLYRTGSAALMDAYYSSAIRARESFDTLWQITRKRIKQ